MIGGRSALLGAAGGSPYGNWAGNYSDVSLLLRGNETPALVPFDESPTPKVMTVVGQEQEAFSTEVFKYGSGSIDLSRGTNYLETSLSSADFNFSNSPFTIEAWIYAVTLVDLAGVFSFMNNGAAASISGYVLYTTTAGGLIFNDRSSSSVVFTISSAAGVVTAGSWHHVAVCKEGTGTNQVRLFVNGNLVASGTRNANIPVASFTAPGRVGAWRYSEATRPFNGFIDDLRITKGIARYSSIANFTPPTAELPANITDDPSYNSVSLLLRGNEIPVSAPFDESPTPKVITRIGDARISTTVFKYGTSSLEFDGSEDYFSSPLDAGFDFGTGDFTIECWVNLNTLATDQTFVSYASGTSGSLFSFSLERLSTGAFRVFVYSGTTLYVATASPSITTGTWYHVAGVRSGGQLRCYVNGVGGTAVNANVSANVAAGRILTIGAYHTSLRFVNGFIDDLRITKGVARYNIGANFTPPAAELPVNITDDPSYDSVSLLLRNETPSGTFPSDESPTPKTITRVGDAGISTTTFKYGTSALSFDGSGDYLEASDASLNLGSGDFTVEAWINPNNTSAGYRGIIGDNLYTSAGGFAFYQNGSAIEIWRGGAVIINATSVLTAGVYQHVAWVRQSGLNRCFVNGAEVGNSISNSNNYTATVLWIGRVLSDGTNFYFHGFIDDLRITKGIARYVRGMVFAGTNNLALPAAELPANITDDPSYDSVSLLLRNETPSGTFPSDESPTPKTITRVGDAGISTTTFKYGTSALSFDGSGDYFSSPLNAGFDFGTGDFTIECWVNLNTLATNQSFVTYAAGTSGSVTSFSLDRLSTGVFRVYVYSGTAPYIATVSPSITTGTWYHVAGVRSGGQLRCYVNGVAGTAVSANVSANVAAGRILTVGSFYTSVNFVNGFIDDLRITKGIARYTKNFLPPPAQLPAI